MTDELPEMHERIIAGRLLSLSAARISKHVGSFGSWLLAGVGLAYSLVLANLASVQQFVSLSSIRTSLMLLLAAIIFGVLQRWLAAIVEAGATTGEKAEKIGLELAEQDIEVDFKIVFREIERGAYYPAKWMMRRSFEKVMSGDFAAPGRLSFGIAQIQSWLVFAQVGCAAAAIGVTACGVKV